MRNEEHNTKETVVIRCSCWTRRLEKLELSSFEGLQRHVGYQPDFKRWIERGGDLDELEAKVAPDLPLRDYSWDDRSLTSEQRFFRILVIALQEYWK